MPARTGARLLLRWTDHRSWLPPQTDAIKLEGVRDAAQTLRNGWVAVIGGAWQDTNQ